MVYDESEWPAEPKPTRRNSEPIIPWFWAGVAAVVAIAALMF